MSRNLWAELWDALEAEKMPPPRESYPYELTPILRGPVDVVRHHLKDGEWHPEQDLPEGPRLRGALKHLRKRYEVEKEEREGIRYYRQTRQGFLAYLRYVCRQPRARVARWERRLPLPRKRSTLSESKGAEMSTEFQLHDKGVMPRSAGSTGP